MGGVSRSVGISYADVNVSPVVVRCSKTMPFEGAPSSEACERKSSTISVWPG